jgi:hypothetical protein
MLKRNALLFEKFILIANYANNGRNKARSLLSVQPWIFRVI